jgi:hypothetical protein
MHRYKTSLFYLVGLAAWLLIAAHGIWHYAYLETEPPVFDALSYVQKAHAFWAAVDAGKHFNPFKLVPQIRPFGTVFFTHPFGFSTDFHRFFFLTNFLPAILLIIASLVAIGSPRKIDQKQTLVVAVTLICFSSMPVYFQFATSGDFRFMGTWGFVDILFGAISALACAFVVASMRGRFLLWTTLSALCAILSILIKPVGLAVMAEVLAAWSALTFSQWRCNRLELKTAMRGGLLFVILFGVTGLVLRNSQYFSHENYEYGLSSMKLLHAEQQALPTLLQILEKIRVSIGLPVLILWLLCLACASRARQWMLVTCSLAIFFSGCYLWLDRTNLNHVRYFFPFPLMAIVFVLPALIQSARTWNNKRLAILSLLILPTIAMGILLSIPGPSAKAQFVLGMNLVANRNADVVKQASALVAELASEPDRKSIIYYVGGTPKINAFEAVMDWHRLLDLPGGNSVPALPIDWVRPPAYRLDELLRARFIVFEPVKEAQSALQTQKIITSYYQEQELIRAWLSALSPKDGVKISSNGSVRVIEVLDRIALNQAGVELMHGRKMRAEFVSGFHPLVEIPVDMVATLPGNFLTSPIDLYYDGKVVARALAVTRTAVGDETLYHIVFEQVRALPPNEKGKWQVFVHMLDKNNKMIKDGYQTYISDALPRAEALQYDIPVPTQTSNEAVAVAFGVFKPLTAGTPPSFISPHGDWNGRRNVVDLSSSTGR